MSTNIIKDIGANLSPISLWDITGELKVSTQFTICFEDNHAISLPIANFMASSSPEPRLKVGSKQSVKHLTYPCVMSWPEELLKQKVYHVLVLLLKRAQSTLHFWWRFCPQSHKSSTRIRLPCSLDTTPFPKSVFGSLHNMRGW